MIVDIIVIAILLISAVIAFLRGFIREVLTIFGFLGGVVAAYLGAPLLSPLVAGWLGVEEGVEPARLFGTVPYDLLASILSYGGLFIGVVVILSVVSHFLAEAARNLGLGAVDRTFGVMFGVARGVVLLGLLYLPVHLLVDQDTKNKWFEGSRTHFYLEQSSAAISGLLPKGTVEKMHQETKKAEEALGARKKLQDIDVLRKEEGEGANGGYSDEFRDQMNELIEEKSHQLNE